jgi:hypothetical protein
MKLELIELLEHAIVKFFCSSDYIHEGVMAYVQEKLSRPIGPPGQVERVPAEDHRLHQHPDRVGELIGSELVTGSNFK